MGREGERDHPRSRGVYSRRFLTVYCIAGSSPLARGLPADAAQGDDARGIIPARAGFTPGRGRTSTVGGDHPRSRGVYSLLVLLPVTAEGSSPLARGLLVSADLSGASPRIIPARAGFTHFSSLFGWWVGDHPRSRGVYDELRSAHGDLSGSSPLARGLPGFIVRGLSIGGIIPARAGFTSKASRSAAHAADHPRSRGVYRSCRESIAC